MILQGSFGSFVLYVSSLIIGTFLLGLIFKGRLRIIRYTLWGISGLFLILVVLSGITHNLRNQSRSQDFVGEYKLDMTESKSDSIDLKKYLNLSLTVRDENTFSISSPTPFFASQTGHWRNEDDGEHESIFCSFGGNSNNEVEIAAGTDSWTFENHSLVNGRQSDRIVFTNVKYLQGQK